MNTILGRRRSGASTEAVAPDLRDQQLVWRIAGELLDYPHPSTLALAPQLARAAAQLPAPAGPALLHYLDRISGVPQEQQAREYVETFDLRRRHCLHLTYFAYGDTRKRGMALLRFKHAYREAGAELGDHELPDHLCVVLEFAAISDPGVGRRLLMEYQPVLELLRRALHSAGAAQAHLLDAILATLPPLDASALRRVAELAAQGPPQEEVGLEPYGMDPALAEHLGGKNAGAAGLDPESIGAASAAAANMGARR